MATTPPPNTGNQQGGNQKKKQNQATDKIRLKVADIVISPSSYKMKIQIIINSKDGKAKVATPFTVTKNGKKWIDGITDTNGMFECQKTIKYCPNLNKFNILSKVTGSAAEEDKDIQLPAPNKMICQGKVLQNPDGFTAIVFIRVGTNANEPRPNCPVECSGNGKLWNGVTDNNGKFSFTDDKIERFQIDEEVVYTITAGAVTEPCKVTIPCPGKITVKGSICQNANGYTGNISGKVETKTGKLLLDYPIKWKGNGQGGDIVTDSVGNFKFEDATIGKASILDEINYTIEAGLITESCKITVPVWKNPQGDASKIFNDFPNWKHNRGQTIWYVVRTIGIFLSAMLLAKLAGDLGKYSACLFVGLAMYLKKDGDGKRGIWRPIIASLACFALIDSMTFVSWAMIISLVVYIYEDLTKPIDPVTKEPGKHPHNPYPKIPILFAILMIILSIVYQLKGIGGEETSVMFNGVAMPQEVKNMFIDMNPGMVIDEGGGFWGNLLDSLFSVKNWLAYAIVQFLYATPAELKEQVKQKVSVAGVAGVSGFMITLWETLEIIVRHFLRLPK